MQRSYPLAHVAVPENTSKVLEAQLAHRPDVQELIDRNIIKGK